MDEKAEQYDNQQDGSMPTSHSLSLVPDDMLLEKLQNTKNLQKVAREGILIGAGAATILLQVAMPGVASGVDRHSNFAYRPLRRLETTMTFVYCMAFGTKDEKKNIIEAVHRAHAPVRGAGYSADDPELQMWVAATLYAAGVFMYEEVFGRMEASEADDVYREWSIMAESLRVPLGVWPKDREGFWEYWDAKVASLEITPEAKSIANDLLYDMKLPWWLWPILPIVRLTTTYMLPASLQQGYGLKTSRLGLATYNLLVAGVRFTYPALPNFVRVFPMTHYMGQMRQHMAKKR